MARTVSIRRSLLTNLVVMVILLGAAILGVTVFGARRAVRMLSAALITRAIDQTEAELRRFFEPVDRGLMLTGLWGETGLLDLEEPERLDGLLASIIRSTPHVSSILVADSRGREHALFREGDRLQSRQTRPDEWGHESRWLEWGQDRSTAVASTRELDYDARQRPWYRGALEERPKTHWSEPYTFFTGGALGITASRSFAAGDGLDHVVGFDVLLSEISEFATNFQVSANGMAFVLSSDRRFLGIPGRLFASETERRAALLERPIELGVPLLSDLAQAVQGRPAAEPGPIRFWSGGAIWWGETRPFPLGPRREIRIAVLVPESDLLGGLTEIRVGIVAVTLSVLALAVLRAIAMARRYSLPVEVLVHESDRISRGDLEPGPPLDTSVTEMGRLALAHDRMRTARRSLLKLERDLQVARQIQQNTFPEQMPVLDGYAIDGWSEPAEETGGDTYDVIGLSRSRAGTSFVSAERAERVVLLLADATGHGIGPALSVTQVRAMLRMAARVETDLPRIAQHMNEQLCQDLREGRFVTAWLGELDCGNHCLASLSAGQAPILHYDARGNCFVEYQADTTPLGIMPELDVTLGEPIRMAPGDIVAVMSDGVFEAANAEGDPFGVERVKQVLSGQREATPAQMLEALRASLALFVADTPAADDRTAIILKRTGP